TEWDGNRARRNWPQATIAAKVSSPSPSFLTDHPGGHYRMAEPCDFDGDGRIEVITGADFGPVFYFRRSLKDR
ncbi:MAG: hypothetical protein CMJ64_12400, partial [Planctomycetaceae bacterium]|nr:hypothetical protein [Planctomycetaceae bacterium]